MGYVLLSARTELLELKVPEVYHVKADGIIFMGFFAFVLRLTLKSGRGKDG